MEEILASIRRMIAEDDPARGRAATGDSARVQATPSAEPSASVDDDVLELTEALDDPRPTAPPAPAGAVTAPARRTMLWSRRPAPVPRWRRWPG